MDLEMFDDSLSDAAVSIADDSDAFSPDDMTPKAKAKPKAKAAPKPKAAPKAKAPAKPKAATKAAPKKLTQTTLTSKLTGKKRPIPGSDDEDPEDDGSTFSHTPPSAKKQKKTAGASKKSNGKPLDEIENESMLLDSPQPPPAPAGGSKKTAEERAAETYQQLSPIQHIIKRPDTYIGSVEMTESQMWVFNKESKQMELRKVNYVPGLYKIFDEILVNAADNKQRDSSEHAPMTALKVTIDRASGEISVENNGKGIPVVIHATKKMYVPQMIFGELLTGSNYDDNEKKTVGGRNGYGAKLCNIFSTEFTVEVQDSENGKRYKQTWNDNMGKISKPKITSNKTASFVRITFKPDFKMFNMPDGIDDDLEALVYRRIYDMAGTVKGVKVYLNGELLKLKDFKSYCELYAKAISLERSAEEGGDPKTAVFMDKGVRRWEVGFTVSDGAFQQISFVNSIATTTGGTHVSYITDQITNYILAHLNKKRKGHGLKQNHIRNHLFVFINCYIDNPAFTSQTKEQMTTKVSQFGSKCALSEEFLKKIAKSEAIEHIMDFAEKKADKMMAKSDGNKRSRINNAKLVDANLAGTRHGHECTLILTEGDSAKGLAVSGRAILDPDRIGVFPLRGKMLNVRDASIDQITKNQEVQNIKQFLGLKHKTTYTDTKGLRYGHLMIMADQDHDGSHIKGLLINFLQVQYPSLLQIPNFFREFITPIVKVWQGSNPKKPTKLKTFFTQPEYENWKIANRHELGKWDFKYFKGLGTSSNEDAQVYFTNLDAHLKEFDIMKPEESDMFDLAFSKKKADARKEWLGNFVPGTFLDNSAKTISYTDFVNKELILFSMADNMRSIPSVIDGLKPGQRKVMYACLKTNVVKDKKVVDLAGVVSSLTQYQHGEASLQQTIIGLAQNFVGSNNVNCLEPSGNFGSRLAGGSDAASPRYIYTRLSPFARKVFPAMDEPNLESNYEDGKPIEPKVFAPVVPMVLVNGADGIGTGWSTSIPNYHPADIVENLKRRMGRLDEDDDEEKPFQPMAPWFRGWKGTSEPAGPDRFKFNGVAHQNDKTPNEIIVTELPIRVWTDDFKARLEEVISGAKGPSWIKDYKEFNDHKNVHFEIMLSDEKAREAVLKEGIIDRFKLAKQIATSNLVAFDSQGQIRKYEKVEDIMEEFYQFRMHMYTERKKHWLQVYHTEYRKMTNQARFITEIMDEVLIVNKKKKDVIIQELRDANYEAFPPKSQDGKKRSTDEELGTGTNEGEEGSGGAAQDSDPGVRDYDYLLSMAIWSFTAERLEKLKEQIDKKKQEHDDLLVLSEKDLWCSDLDAFLIEWEKQLKLDAEIQTSINRMGRRVSKKIGAGRGRKGAVADDDDFEPTKAKAKGKAKAKPAVAPKVEKTHQRFAEMFSAKPKAKPKEEDASDAGGASDFSDDDFAAIKGKTATSAKAKKSESESVEPVETMARSKRAAAAKPKAWIVDSDSDSDGDNLLGDIDNMVKGISKPAGSSAQGRVSLFTMTQGGTGSNLPKAKTKPRTFDFSEDDTNYEMLAKSSPRKSIKGDEDNDIDQFLSDDDNFPPPKAASKAAPKPVAPPKRAAAPKAKPKASKETLSPAAKAYAKKASKKAVSEDEDEDVGGRNEDEGEDSEVEEVSAAPPKRGRPAAAAKAKPKAKPAKATTAPAAKRKAAAKKAVSDDDEEEESFAPRGRPARAARAAKPKAKYVESDDEEDDFQEDADSDDPFAMDSE
ncbi:related to DNA topoisomerase II [Cephalotrichum gorgonifer]|uniref:DNA topoisomerase 2 n=1 Tax=Cephalotrichum gorgonifer TaxID=2041049 RepID=A0AAE8MRX4_9PEZI|nr:related to DNA topoisomerase II [Cephalotrichum gorgonifer]